MSGNISAVVMVVVAAAAVFFCTHNANKLAQ